MLQWKIPHAATKTWHSQINTFLFFNKKISLPSTYKYPPGTLHWSHTHFQSALQTVARMFFLKMQIWSSLSPVYKPPVTSTAIFPSPTLHFLALAAHKTSLRSVSVRSALSHWPSLSALSFPALFQTHGFPHTALSAQDALPRLFHPTSTIPLDLLNFCSFFKVQLNPDCPRLQQVPWVMLSCYSMATLWQGRYFGGTYPM